MANSGALGPNSPHVAFFGGAFFPLLSARRSEAAQAAGCSAPKLAKGCTEHCPIGTVAEITAIVVRVAFRGKGPGGDAVEGAKGRRTGVVR